MIPLESDTPVVTLTRFSSEAEFIARIRRLARGRPSALVEGIGDDAAVFQPRESERWCITTDLLVEGVHFDLHFDTAHSLGHKSLASGLSDIAAMGAIPRYALVSIAVPRRRASKFLEPFYQGLLGLARSHNVTLIGGDTSRSGDSIFVDVIVLGNTQARHEILRRGARTGDRIFVTGELGKAALGLQLLKSKKSKFNLGEKLAIQSHRFPSPRLEVGIWLGKGRRASSMIDVSDGLSTDLCHLCDESGVGAKIFEDRVPLFEKGQARASLDHALSGGEDYELLFTVRPEKLKTFAPELAGVPLREMGEIVPRSEGITLIRRNGTMRPLRPTGWDHFR